MFILLSPRIGGGARMPPLHVRTVSMHLSYGPWKAALQALMH
jgi:hypothetical protein